MTQSKSTKRALIASAASVLISCAMLVGTTFAWFTDSVSSGKNVIQAGNLDITAVYQNTAETGTTYTIEGFDRNNGEVTFGETATDINKDNAIITEKLWEPGAVGAKLITVKNNGNLAAKVKLRFEVEDKGLQEGLWFDFIQVKSDGTVSGQFTKREMSTLSELANKVELPLLPKGTEGKDRVSFILLYGMKEEAGNQYMNTSFEADVTILATQYTYESDSFDNQYDQDAAYPVSVNVSDKDSLKDALNHPGVPADITLTETIGSSDDLTVTGDVTLNLGQNRLNQSNMDIVGADISVNNGGSLVINAISPDGWAYNAGKLMADGSGSSLTVNGGKYGDSGYQNAEVSAKNGSVVYLTEGSFSTSGAEGHAVVAESGATVYISGGSYSSSGAKSSVLYADGGTIIITNYKSVTANGVKFSAANGGKILISKAFLSTKPTSVGTGCTVADDGENWLISANE